MKNIQFKLVILTLSFFALNSPARPRRAETYTYDVVGYVAAAEDLLFEKVFNKSVYAPTQFLVVRDPKGNVHYFINSQPAHTRAFTRAMDLASLKQSNPENRRSLSISLECDRPAQQVDNHFFYYMTDTYPKPNRETSVLCELVSIGIY